MKSLTNSCSHTYILKMKEAKFVFKEWKNRD